MLLAKACNHLFSTLCVPSRPTFLFPAHPRGKIPAAVFSLWVNTGFTCLGTAGLGQSVVLSVPSSSSTSSSSPKPPSSSSSSSEKGAKGKQAPASQTTKDRDKRLRKVAANFPLELRELPHDPRRLEPWDIRGPLLMGADTQTLATGLLTSLRKMVSNVTIMNLKRIEEIKNSPPEAAAAAASPSPAAGAMSPMAGFNYSPACSSSRFNTRIPPSPDASSSLLSSSGYSSSAITALPLSLKKMNWPALLEPRATRGRKNDSC